MQRILGESVKTLFSLLSILSFSAIAQPASWAISDVKDKDRIAGYILHTSAKGTSVKGPVNEKHVTGIRFICTSPNYRAMDEGKPLLAIFWQGLSGYNEYDISVKVDNISIKLDKKWTQDNQILFQTVRDSSKLIDAFKTGKTFYANWTVGIVTRSTAFDITGFESKYTEYLKLCNGKL